MCMISFIEKEAGGTGPVHISAGSIAFFGGLFLKQRTERKASWRFHLVPGKTNVVRPLLYFFE